MKIETEKSTQPNDETELLRVENDRLKAELKAATEPSEEELLIRQKMAAGLRRDQAIAAIRNQRVFSAAMERKWKVAAKPA